ncbi:hypothetical protein RRG08_064498 [Elysia crispata]|uniref:Uncharacterized protein n=1 Tax=Elysia crispata TaxID=231223 RepID=A0AAE1DX51_9GAST|nr:hypothetical protein RRG08_064498 [Elysia crispata]
MEGNRLVILAILCAWHVASSYAQVSPKTDVVFLLDSSNAVGPAKLASLRAFLLDLVQQWNIGPDGVQVSVVSYGAGIHEEFDLDTNGDIQSVKQAVLSVPFRGGTSDQADGIKYARDISFTSSHGARPDANHVIIHVTDQAPADPGATVREAQLAFDQGTKLYSIAVGDGSGPQQMNKMTSDPLSRYLLKADTYSSLKSLVPVLGSRINNEVPSSSANLPPPSSCLQTADLVFLIDSSSSVGQNDFHHLEDFLKDVIMQLPVQPDKVRVGVAQYGNHPSLEFGLDVYSERLSLMRAVDSVQFMGGGTNTGSALHYATDKIFSPALGSRQNVPHIAVVITDGQSGDQAATAAAADRARQKGVNLIAMGVGHNVDQAELASIADDPDNGHVFQSISYKDLKALSTQILDAACKVKLVTTTAPAAGVASPQPCVDKLSNCGYYSKDTCNDYRPWAEEHCAKFCGFCTVDDQATPCADQLDCSGYPVSVCTDPNYLAWNTVNCPRYCGLCRECRHVLYHNTCLADNRGLCRECRHVLYHNTCLADNRGLCRECRHVLYHNTCLADNRGLCRECRHVLYHNTCLADNRGLCRECRHVLYHNTCLADNRGLCRECRHVLYHNTCLADNRGLCRECRHVLYHNTCLADNRGLCRECRHVLYHNTCLADNRGLCPETSEPLGYYGQCFYKGMAYSHGEKWLDGCDYECVCEDGHSGQYSCYNRCPVYQDLPRDCTLITVPGECCLKPVCDFNQKVTTTQGSGKGINSQGIDMCVYAGRQYYTGQSWEIGCDLKCTCTEARLGTYVCQSYCPTYTTVPPYCRLVRKPGDCCETPVCEFNTVTGVRDGRGTTSGRGIAAIPDPVCVNKQPDCTSAGKAACREFPQWAQENCALYCDMCVPATPAANPDDRCLHDGKAYNKGDRWPLGCDLECVCEVPELGYYRCDSKCPKYSNLPATCSTHLESGECCPQTVCPSGAFYPSSTNVTSVGNGDGLSQRLDNGQTVNVLPSKSPRVASGGQVNFNWRNRIDGCLFQGRVFVQGQQWQVGCQLTCVCADATVGKYQCRDRCPTYENVPPTCQNVTDPADTCCVYPAACGPGTNYVPIPVYPQEVTSISAVMSPSVTDLLSGQVTTQLTVALDGITVRAPTTPSSGQGSGYCIYKNVRYQHAATWEDGCLYNCVCEDGLTGTYRCIEKCERYVQLPAECHLEQDPNNPCCERPVCVFADGHEEIRGNRSSTLAPAPPTPASPTTKPPFETAMTTLAPPTGAPTTLTPPTITPPTMKPTPGRVPEMCRYEGNLYTEGQTWYDACDFKCTCVDGLTNSYTCLTRCPLYEGDFSSCAQVADPEDPQCCSVPSCTGEPIPPGRFTGTGTVPARDKCLYKGALYSSGETWQDGCRFQCECTDPGIGLYQCTNRCPKVAAVPQGCALVPDVINPCCQTVACSPTPSPGSGGSTVEPPKADVCVYEQATYFEGQSWFDGCQKQCRCEQAGIYTCTDRCPSYEGLPQDCVLVTDDLDPCCKKAQCSPLIGVTVGTGQVPTLPPKVVTGVAEAPDPGLVPRLGACVYKGVLRGQGEQWFDGCQYSCTCEGAQTGRFKCTDRCPSYAAVPPQCQLLKDAAEPCCEVAVCDPNYVTPGPGVITTLSPPHTAVCVYEGKSYTQGQSWYAGCDYRCVCEDADQGIYRCTNRCPYLGGRLPGECQLVPDPSDPLCCEVASCRPAASNTSAGYLIPTLPPATFTGRQVTPTPGPEQVPQPDVCIYGGQTYRPGQRWTDGCQLDCLCEGQGLGRYTCTEICPDYSNQPTPPTIPPQATLIPGVNRNACVYNGVMYFQDSHWNDGCEFTCVCEDSTLNKYRCDQRCPRYDSVPTGCSLETDPQDSCCQVVICDPSAVPNPAPVPYPTPYPIPAKLPGKTTGQSVGNTTGFCQYNGVSYRQGDMWDDGCEATCVCLDQRTGIYDCIERCVEFLQLPMTCQLVSDPNDSCCSVPKCGGEPTSTSSTISPAPGSPPTPSPKPGTTSPTVSPAPGSPPTPSPKPGTTSPTVSPAPGSPPTPSPKPGTTSPTVSPAPGSPPTPSPKPGTTSPTVSPAPGSPPTPSPKPGTTSPTVSPAPGSPPTPSPKPGTTSPTVSPAPGSPPAPSPKPGTTSPTVSPAPGSPPTPSPKPGTTSPTVSPAPGSPPTPSPKPGTTSPTVSPAPGSPPTPSPKPGTTSPTVSPAPGSPPTPSPKPGTTSPTELLPQQFPLHRSLTPTTASPTPILSPNSNPTPSSTLTPRSDVCVYNGQWYTQDQVWYDGCSQVCRCENSRLNYTMCNQRCKQYLNVPDTCTMIADPDDPACCLIPDCDPGTGQTVTGLTGRVTGFGTPPSGITQTPIYGTYTPVPLANVCLYKGVAYAAGQRWRDGCEFSCECLNGITGRYECVEICPSYPNPGGCPLVREPLNPCCLVPSCTPDPGATPLLTPTPYPLQVSTLVPQTAFCVYQGTPYKQYAQWHDGCALNCRCEDASLNQINCDQRCPDYSNFPDTCTLITDPTDACCQVPLCVPTPGATPSPGLSPSLTVTGVRGSFTGSSGTPADPNRQGDSPGLRTGQLGVRQMLGFSNSSARVQLRFNDSCAGAQLGFNNSCARAQLRFNNRSASA